MTDQLSYCNPRVTCVVQAKLETVWDIVKQWSSFYWLSRIHGQECKIRAYEGSENAIGSVRSVEIGDSRMFERLVAMDSETHTMKWRTIAHPDSLTPFKTASYINTIITMTLREVTHDDHTFVDWQAAFYTEPEFGAEMHTVLESWLLVASQTLQKHVFTENPTVNQRQISTSPKHALHPHIQQAEDVASRFADLHVAGGIGHGYGIPDQSQVEYQPGPSHLGHEPLLPQTGKPMGTALRQPPVVGASQPTMQAWQASQTHPGHQSKRIPRGMTPEGARAVQDWATKQQQAHHPHRHVHRAQAPSYAGSQYSQYSGSDDGMKSSAARLRHPSHLGPESVYSQRGSREFSPEYMGSHWQGPQASQGSMYYDQMYAYDPRGVGQGPRPMTGPPQNHPSRKSRS